MFIYQIGVYFIIFHVQRPISIRFFSSILTLTLKSSVYVSEKQMTDCSLHICSEYCTCAHRIRYCFSLLLLFLPCCAVLFCVSVSVFISQDCIKCVRKLRGFSDCYVLVVFDCMCVSLVLSEEMWWFYHCVCAELVLHECVRVSMFMVVLISIFGEEQTCWPTFTIYLTVCVVCVLCLCVGTCVCVFACVCEY